MHLSTQLVLPSSDHKFGYRDKLLFLGSCFAQNIGAQLLQYKFNAVVNPFGILFHPQVIARTLLRAVNGEKYSNIDVFEHNEIWQSYCGHSLLNGMNAQEVVDNFNTAQQQLITAISESSHIFITLGTAWGYREKQTGSIVANCHKVAQHQFDKSLLSVVDCQAALCTIITAIQALNSSAVVVFTVSPVRHIKDGLINNSRSKAHLLAAVHAVCDTHNARYFPAYEILIDELRDYRFYAADMLHPSQQAIAYIFEQFINVFAFAKAQEGLKKVREILRAKNHRPFNPNSQAHKKFKENLAKKISHLQAEYPDIEI